MKSANPDQTSWDSLQFFIHLSQAVAKALILQISKTHHGILLNYAVFQLETRIISLQASYNQMLLGILVKMPCWEMLNQLIN